MASATRSRKPRRAVGETQPPNAPEAERATISALIVLGDQAPAAFLDALTPGDFFDPAYATLWELLSDGLRNGYPIDRPDAFRLSIREYAARPDSKASFESLWEIYAKVLNDAVDATFWRYYVHEVKKLADARRALIELDAAQAEIRRGGDLSTALVGRLAKLESLARPPAQDGPRPGPILISLDRVEEKSVAWLWEGRIPLGTITAVVGYGGQGKSFFSCGVASAVSRGTPFVDGSPCPSGAVVVLAGEDQPSQLRKRYEANGADMSRIRILEGQYKCDRGRVIEASVSLHDIEAIRQAVEQVEGVRLLIVDPIGNFIPGIDSHKDNEVRSLLSPLAALAEEKEIAVLMIAHRKKSGGERADNVALGSVAFTNTGRSTLHVMDDPNEGTEVGKRKLVLHSKSNYGPLTPCLAFRIRAPQGVIEWDRNPPKLSADEAMRLAGAQERGDRGPEAEARNEAEDYLREALRDGPRPMKELVEEAKEAEGIALGTLKRAKKSLGVEAYRTEIPGPWIWRLPTQPESRAPWP